MSAFWEQLYPAATDPDGDADGDGVSNFEEYLAGTNPLDSADWFRVSGLERITGGDQVRLRWQGVRGKRYQVEDYDAEAGVWLEGPSVIAEAGGEMHLDLIREAPSGIFRLRAGDIDEDGDGLTAWEEGLLGWSDADPRSNGVAGRTDYIAAFRLLEGSGTQELANGVVIPQRPATVSEAARFLTQASFGADRELIDHVVLVGIGGWLDEQLHPAITTSTDEAMWSNGDQSDDNMLWGKGWWKAVMTGPDQLRQRMGYALSQILVISAVGSDPLRGSFLQAHYYDMLMDHAFGSYRALLEDVTYSTQMGLYLSHIQNRKSDPSIGRFPDENFAREIMQLFTIGLWELNPDGTRKLDEAGEPIPTYDNATIMEMAKVFTGFSFGGPNAWGFFVPVNQLDYVHPMKMWDEEHESGQKHIVSGVVIPDGQTGEQDIADALDALCAHPNIGPFLSHLLIQRFTSSNPSPDYVRRVAAVWDDNGSGERGDLKAVVEAILLDPEARTPEAMGEASGKVREPQLRLTALLRAFSARNSRIPATFPVWTGWFARDFGQQVLWAPSVFNFYLPDHRPAGEMRERGLVSPELEIATADRLVATDNFFQRIIERGMDPFSTPNPLDIIHCDFSYEQSISGDAGALVDHLDELLTHGMMSPGTRAAVVAAVQAQATAKAKVETAVHLISQSPDFVVLK